MRRRGLLLAILVYVSLDLALPAMPGAFVFDPADSVESAGGGRQAIRIVVAPAAPPGTLQPPPAPAGEPRHHLSPRGASGLARWPAGGRRPPGAREAPLPAEDPHRAVRLR